MANLTVVSNAGPLIALASINKLELLRLLFGTIVIPGAVYREVVTMGEGRPGEAEVREADWIQKSKIRNRTMVKLLRDRLDAGESETIVLATEVKADYVLLDERLARRKANLIGLTAIGSLGILLMAKKAGFIPKVSALLLELEQAAFRISADVRSEILQKAEEE
jgi:predicted nucleic acid-binding protein